MLMLGLLYAFAVNPRVGCRAPCPDVGGRPGCVCVLCVRAFVQVWDYDTGECERTLKGHTNVVQGVAFSPDGQALASCGADTTVKVIMLLL